MEKKLKVIGITGGIGSGKSTITKFLRKHFWTVLDADEIAKEVVMPGKPALKEIEKIFGKESLNIYGELKRDYISKLVFNDRKNLEKLNYTVHKFIFEYIDNSIEITKQNLQNLEKSGNNLKTLEKIFIDAPLLIESKLYEKCDEIWLITADKGLRIERAMKNYNLTREQVIDRINSQLSDEKKKEYADVIFENNGTVEKLYNKIKEYL